MNTANEGNSSSGGGTLDLPSASPVRDVHRAVAFPSLAGVLRCQPPPGAGRHPCIGGVRGARSHRLIPARTRPHTHRPAQGDPRDPAEPEDHSASYR